MSCNFDINYTLDCFLRLVNTSSPVGYYRDMKPLIETMAGELGLKVTYDRKSTCYITLEGQDNSKTVLIGAHLDTIGMAVRSVDANGFLRVRQLGGVNFSSMEGESVTVHTRGGKAYTGLLTVPSHSVHVFEDAREMARDEEHMVIILDEDVHSREDVRALGIMNGDPVAVEPRCEVTPNGYLKSRFIDDKAAVACCFTLMKYLKENSLQPACRTILAFPFAEEIGLGGTYVPEDVSEFVAIDIGLIGPELDGSERKVSICAKDKTTPYDYDLTSHLVELAEKAGCDYALDVYYRYGTDANAALGAGANLRAASFGMAVYCSHGRERTHIEGLKNTVKLLIAYALEG